MNRKKKSETKSKIYMYPKSNPYMNRKLCESRDGEGAMKASELLREMQRKGLKPDRYSYTSAIHACSKAGNPSEALRLLRAMETNNVKWHT